MPKLIIKMLPLWLCTPFLSMIITCHLIGSSSQCHPDESSALLQLNTEPYLWNNNIDCCTWIGVECDKSTGHVVSLDLSYGRLRGIISSNTTFFLLRHLQRLVIHSAHVQGYQVTFLADAFDLVARNLTSLRMLSFSNIDMSFVSPASLMNLSSSSLTVLILRDCLLRGELPGDVFHSFLKLESLDLSRNNLGGLIPWSVFNLKCLNYFDLSYNNFEGKLPERNLSSSLVFIALSRNKISGQIPLPLYTLPNLDELYLDNNHFTGEIGKFWSNSLQILALNSNEFHGVIPRSLFQLVELMELDLSSNNLSGNLNFNELISKLKRLIVLDLSSNNLSLSFDNSINHTDVVDVLRLRLSSCNLVEFPHSLRSFKKLLNLDFSNNRIQGSVPKWFWEVSKDSLSYLNLSHNSLKNIDPLPWNKLTLLDLRSNFFSGPLPIFLSQLSFILVSRNQFSGEISSSICDLLFLRVLDLSYNNFIGNIPQCMVNFSTSYLSVLNLRYNELNGTIPNTFAEGHILQSLNLNGNRLEGMLPRSLMNCQNLRVLDLGNNLLNDTFPNWLESVPGLEVLVLRGNKFHGTIENLTTRFAFHELKIMDLSHNEFNGNLPTIYFENFKAMQTGSERLLKERYIKSEIYYEDSIMVTLKGWYIELERIQTILMTIDLSNNKFSGNISESTGRLKSLKGLNISHNKLTGILPSSFGNLTNLEWLDLSSNEISGKIPIELANIPRISFLNLSHNQLEGPIPHGNQFNTFSNESFIGNLNLCGFPLSTPCGEETNRSKPSSLEQDGHSIITSGFSWKIVIMGYTSGFVIGISIGYMLLY